MLRTVALLAALSLPAPAHAQPLPRCGPPLAGQVAASGCICRYVGGGTLLRQPSGWQWQCDLLRGPGLSDPGDQPPDLGY